MRTKEGCSLGPDVSPYICPTIRAGVANKQYRNLTYLWFLHKCSQNFCGTFTIRCEITHWAKDLSYLVISTCPNISMVALCNSKIKIENCKGLSVKVSVDAITDALN